MYQLILTNSIQFILTIKLSKRDLSDSMINRSWWSLFADQAIMDVEAALLENSPTLSTISSDCTDTTYSGPGSPYSPESPIIVTSSYKKTKDDEITPRPTPRHPLPPRKPNFRIRPPYLMICISIIEVTLISPLVCPSFSNFIYRSIISS